MGPGPARAIVSLLLCASSFAQAASRPRPGDALAPDWIRAGPMIGHVGPHSARVWLRLKKGADLGVRGSLLLADGSYRSVRAQVEKRGDRVRLVTFTGLPPDTSLNVQFFEGPHPTRGAALTLRTAPRPAKTGLVRLAFGSGCNDILFPKARVLAAAAQAEPDLFLFVGDSTHYVREYRVERITKKGNKKSELRIDTRTGDGDWTGTKRMFARQLATRTTPWLQPLLRRVPCYAIWDDHDFGTAGAGHEFAERKKSLKVFRKMWANPFFGVDGTKGCFSSFRRGPVELFLMDGRYHREGRIVWGDEQLAWLCDGLRRSTAPVKIIANGTPFLAADGHFGTAPREYAQLLACLDEHRIGGVLFLTGDRRFSEMLALSREGRPVVLEFTSGPLSWGDKIAPCAPVRRRKGVGSAFTTRGDSFGLVTIDIPARGVGTVTCEVRDRKNGVPAQCKKTWRLAELVR